MRMPSIVESAIDLLSGDQLAPFSSRDSFVSGRGGEAPSALTRWVLMPSGANAPKEIVVLSGDQVDPTARIGGFVSCIACEPSRRLRHSVASGKVVYDTHSPSR